MWLIRFPFSISWAESCPVLVMADVKIRCVNCHVDYSIWCEEHFTWSGAEPAQADLSHGSHKAGHSKESPDHDSGKF
jgi:hypothetical protein